MVAGGLLLLMRKLIPNKALYEAPQGDQPPPVLDSRAFGDDLHRRQFYSRLE
jgi:hypothetical protein